MKIKEGDYVRVIARECTPADAKNGLFYGYFAGICGTVERIYEGNEVCLKVDLETLPQDILKRHIEIQESIKRKWLNGLSGEARNRLTPEEKQFELSYSILVSVNDIEKAKTGEKTASTEPRPVAVKNIRQLNPPNMETKAPANLSDSAVVEKPAEKTVARSQKPATKVRKEKIEDGDLTPAELEFLKQRERALKKKK
ncbi:MAG: hypothetical protein QME62_06825 [Armatimonadota bacterium]|nr:hypothetical protein [Armatimonadota bacterium]